MTAATAVEKTTRRKIVVIHNPSAGRRGRRRFDATIQTLREAKREVTVLETQKRHDAETFACKLTSSEADVVVAAGGDGTINEVVNGLCGRDIPLAILPLGTVNLLAREIGLGSDAASVAATILSGREQLISFGRANGRLFFAMAGAGLDARVVDGLDLRLKQLIGRGAYAVETIRQLAGYGNLRFLVSVDGQIREAAWVVAAKARYYGGPFELAPRARLTEPSLHVCLFKKGGRLSLLRYMAAVLTHGLARLEDYEIITAKRITIDGPTDEPLQADGDVISHLPAEIEIVPDALSLIVPTTSRQGGAKITAVHRL